MGNHGEEGVAVTSDQSHYPRSSCLFRDLGTEFPSLRGQHVGDVVEMLAVIGVGPDLGRFGEEHSIGKGHDHLPGWSGDPQQFGCNCFWVLQVLPAGHDQGGVHECIRQGKRLIDVEILNPVAVESGIGRQLLGVEAMADHPLVVDLVWQVGDPRRHQVEDRGAGGNLLAIELGEPLPKGSIQVVDETGIAVEDRVVFAVQLEALGWAQQFHCHGAILRVEASLRSGLTGVVGRRLVDPITARRTEQVTFAFPERAHGAFDRLTADQALKQGRHGDIGHSCPTSLAFPPRTVHHTPTHLRLGRDRVDSLSVCFRR